MNNWRLDYWPRVIAVAQGLIGLNDIVNGWSHHWPMVELVYGIIAFTSCYIIFRYVPVPQVSSSDQTDRPCPSSGQSADLAAERSRTDTPGTAPSAERPPSATAPARAGW